MPVNPEEYQEVLHVVHRWTPYQRIALIQELLTTLAFPVSERELGRGTLDQALGLLVANQATPSDIEIENWLREHREEKYG